MAYFYRFTGNLASYTKIPKKMVQHVPKETYSPSLKSSKIFCTIDIMYTELFQIFMGDCLEISEVHCLKSVQIHILSGRYIPALGPNTKIYSFNLCTQSGCEKMQTRKNSRFGHFSHGHHLVFS